MTTCSTHDPALVMRARQMTALTLASLALSAAAAPSKETVPSPQADQVFQRADTDKNGRLSKAEAAAIPEIAGRFDELDKDRDGSLTFEEFLAGYGARR